MLESPKGREYLRPRHRMQNNVKTDFKETGLMV
jgi:hypothetical protein